MNHQQLIQISKARSALATIEPMNAAFLKHCSENSTPQEFPTKLEVDGKSISINAFGMPAVATGRYVLVDTSEFMTEYVFSIAIEGEPVEVWRCYLSSNGNLLQDLETQSTICDYNNSYIAKHLCGNVLLGVLQSTAFVPAAKAGA